MLQKFAPSGDWFAARHHAGMSRLLHELDQRRRLTESLAPLLPDGLREHCQQAAIKGATLLLFADSPVWAAKLRLYAPEVLSRFKTHHPKLKRCQVRVSPPWIPPQYSHFPASKADRRISRRAAAHLEQAAAGIADPELAACFRRLAQRAQNELKQPESVVRN